MEWNEIRGYTNGYQIIIVGQPVDEVSEDDPLYHNCDAMGCSSLEHVIARIPVMYPEPYLMPQPTKPEADDDLGS